MWFVSASGVREFAAPGTEVYERFQRSPLWEPESAPEAPLVPRAVPVRRLKALPPALPEAEALPPGPEAA